ncbi:hypothetical protein REPUB_Repub10bG0117300 [Reevesia pubescens]
MLWLIVWQKLVPPNLIVLLFALVNSVLHFVYSAGSCYPVLLFLSRIVILLDFKKRSEKKMSTNRTDNSASKKPPSPSPLRFFKFFQELFFYLLKFLKFPKIMCLTFCLLYINELESNCFNDFLLLANAWEEEDEVVMITCRLENPDLDQVNGEVKDKLENFSNELYEMRFNMKSGLTSQKKLSASVVDFPQVNKYYTDILEARDSEYKALAHLQSLKSCLDEQNLELRVKTANEAEAISQQRLAAAEAEIAEL